MNQITINLEPGKEYLVTARGRDVSVRPFKSRARRWESTVTYTESVVNFLDPSGEYICIVDPDYGLGDEQFRIAAEYGDAEWAPGPVFDPWDEPRFTTWFPPTTQGARS